MSGRSDGCFGEFVGENLDRMRLLSAGLALSVNAQVEPEYQNNTETLIKLFSF
jgi:hypothetical protein